MTVPIVLFGGFMSFEMVYWGMEHALEIVTGRPVFVVPSGPRDWMRVGLTWRWGHLLRKLDETVKKAVAVSATGKVTLVGHSAGGVLGRIYLGSAGFRGRTCAGVEYVDRLITLGSPHRSRSIFVGGGRVAQWVNKRYPGAYFAPDVEYIAVGGRSIFGDAHGDLRERHAYRIYHSMVGRGDVWGDGLVPLECALLPGARHLVLDGVTHYKICGSPWYGESEEVIARWWPDFETATHSDGSSPASKNSRT